MKTLSDGAEKRRLVEIEYLKEGEEHAERPPRRAVLVRAGAAGLARPHLGPHRRRPAHLPPRSDALGAADGRALRAARGVRPELHDRAADRPASGTRPLVARWKVERGARPLTDHAALAELPFKTEEWLLSEVLADRGETVVLEPAELRHTVARRAKELATELGVSRSRKARGTRA